MACVQLAQFSACVVAARVTCGAVVIAGASRLAHGAAALDRAFRGHPTALLFFVMVVCPVLMNTGQAWVQDHFLKWAAWGAPASHAAAATPPRTEGGHAWEELGHASEAMMALSEDLEARLGPGECVRAGSRASLSDPELRGVVAQRTKSPVPGATADRRLRPPLG